MRSQPWLRLDVDNPISLKSKHVGMALNALNMETGFPIPFFLVHVRKTKELLSKYGVQRTWFFRDFTCPEDFDESFGVHITSPDTADNDIRTVRKKLGDFSLFSRHGNSKRFSGRLWTADEILFVEEEYGLKDVSDYPHIMVSRWNENNIPSNIDHVLFHPCYIYTHKEILVNLLEMICERVAHN